MPQVSDPTQDRMTTYWDRYAAEYDQHQLRRLARPGELETWSQVWTQPLGDDTRTVLDVGTGSGNVALLLSNLGYEVTGIDLSTGMLEQARNKLSAHPNPPAFSTGDGVDPPFAAESFDAIVSRYVLWTLRDGPAALANWRGLLRPGGMLVAVDSPWFADGDTLPRETVRQEDFAEAYDDATFEQLPFGRADAEQVVAALTDAGFEDARVDPLPEVLELDLAGGVAPGHSPQLQYRFTARRPG